LVRFTGKAYELPRTGQRGIPLLSVNMSAVAIAIYRIGDRNLIDTMLGHDFQRNLSRYHAINGTGRTTIGTSSQSSARRASPTTRWM
jgi:uncharacterized protein YfaS (alpha-2-macroglobulin family)